MNIVFRLTPLTLALFFCILAPAQNKSFTGYYINHSGDTVKGNFPNYIQWNRNPSQAKFIPVNSTQPVILTPELCNKFIVTGYDEYISFSGQRLVNPIDDQVLIANSTYSTYNDEHETVVTFLRLLKRAPECDLYIFNDSKRTNFYYQLPGYSITELRYKKYYIQNQVGEVAEYKQQLHNLFGETIRKQGLKNPLERLGYNEDELQEFFIKLFPQTQVKQKITDPKAGLVVTAGASINQMKVKGEKNYAAVAGKYNTTFSPLLSIVYIHPLHRNFGKFFFYPKASVFRYKNSGKSNDATFNNIVTFKSDLVLTVELNGGINLVNHDNFRFFLSVGTGIMYLPGNKEINERYGITTGTLYSGGKLKLRTMSNTINASTGICLSNKFIVSATYQFPGPIANTPVYTSMLSAIQLSFGYKLR